MCSSLLHLLLLLLLLAAAPATRAASPVPALQLREPLTRFDVSATQLRNLEQLVVTFAFVGADAEESLNSDDSVRAYCVDSDSANDDASSVNVDAYIDTQRTKYQAAGALTFGPMVNMRCAWQFRFVTEGGDVLGVSPLVRFARGDAEPLQIHLAATTSASEMRATWTSGAAAAASSRPIIQYGLSAQNLTRSVVATAATYEAKDLCAAPATTESPRWFRDPGRIFTGVMTNLTPSATYFYRVGDAATGALSDVKRFVVPPAPGSAPGAAPMSFAVYGDLAMPTSATGEFRVPGGCGTTMALLEKDVTDAKRAYAAVFHVGDLSYARGATYLWDQFGLLIEGVASRVPYMIGIGNHDYGYLEGKFIDEVRFPANPILEEDGTGGFDSGGECGVPTTTRFPMPANGNGPFWYSSEMGLTHHAVISGEHDVRAGSRMHTWLVDDLSRVNRTRTPWLFLHIHRPLYCSETYESDYRRSLLLRNHLELLLNEYRVDVVFSGHYHAYERTCPVYDEQCYHGEHKEVALAPVHIMVGSAGADVDTEGYYGHDWSLAALREYGYGRVHIYNASHMQFEFVSNELGGVKDSAWIVSNHSWSNSRVREDRTMAASSREVMFVGLGALLMLTLLFFMSRADKRQQQETACFISENFAVEPMKDKDAAASEEKEVKGLLLSEIVTST